MLESDLIAGPEKLEHRDLELAGRATEMQGAERRPGEVAGGLTGFKLFTLTPADHLLLFDPITLRCCDPTGDDLLHPHLRDANAAGAVAPERLRCFGRRSRPSPSRSGTGRRC